MPGPCPSRLTRAVSRKAESSAFSSPVGGGQSQPTAMPEALRIAEAFLICRDAFHLDFCKISPHSEMQACQISCGRAVRIVAIK